MPKKYYKPNKISNSLTEERESEIEKMSRGKYKKETRSRRVYRTPFIVEMEKQLESIHKNSHRLCFLDTESSFQGDII